MRKDTKYYFDLATRVANGKRDNRSFKLGALGIRSDGVIVASPNAPCPIPERRAHAEYRIASKLTPNSVVYVVRILRFDGSLALSRPCNDCQKVLVSRGVSKVYYSISPNEFGIMNLRDETDRYFRMS